MNLSWMQAIDDRIGVPLTWLLGRLTPVARSLGGDAVAPEAPKRVIVSKFIGIGSVVLSLPMLKALKGAGVEIAFLTFPGQAQVARASGLVDHVWTIEPSLRGFLPSLWRSWRASRRFRADAFLDLEPTANFSSLLARLSGAPVRVGFMSHKPRREALFTHLVSLVAGRHMAENCLWMARLVGVPAELSAPLPPVPDACLDSGHAFPVPAGRRRVIVNINTSDLGQFHRAWPLSHWLLICQELLADPAIELAFPGVRAEEAKVEELISRIRETVPGAASRIVNLAGKTSIPALMSILREASLVVSVDSGVMHLAAWAGTPLIGLFGPETPALYAPRSPYAKVLWAALACSPCCTVATEKHTRCRDNQCMKRIPPDQVLMACRLMLSPEGRRPLRVA